MDMRLEYEVAGRIAKDVQGGNKACDDIIGKAEGEGVVRVRIIRRLDYVAMVVIPLNK